MYAPVYALLIRLALPAGLPAQAPADSAGVRRQLVAAARTYEHELRAHATWGPGLSGGTCDETVGRFCLVYEHGRPDYLPPEPERVLRARSAVIKAFRAGVPRLPGDSLMTAFLVRYLAEADSARAALEVASRASGGWRALLRGFALFLDRRTVEAELEFEAALAAMDSTERKRALDPFFLLAPAERERYRALPLGARSAYDERLWRVADPLYLSAGNEARAEHLSRYVWSRILARAPVVARSVSWGRDLEELTRRFGVPKGRTRQTTSSLASDAITDWFDPQQMTYVPPELSRRALTEFVPGAIWPFDTIRARSGFAPPTVRNMSPLEHQRTVLRRRTGRTLRVDAQFILDTLVARPARVEFGLFVLDSAYQRMAEVRVVHFAPGDTARAALELDLPAQAHGYSVEAFEPESRLAARTRHLLEDSIGNALFLSDPILFSAQETLPANRQALRPLTSLVLRRDEPIAVYLESGALRSTDYRIDLSIEALDRPGLFTRAWRRLGEALRGRRITPRVTWSARTDESEVAAIAFQLGALRLSRGLHKLVFTITAAESGASGTVERVVRVR